MNRTLDWATLPLFSTLMFGVIVRFLPAAMNGFPLNDGGMFLAMTRDLQANRYLLPEFTTYNLEQIPFAYPPLGFYVTGILSDLLSIPMTWLFLWLPALINAISILIFYKFAVQILPSRMLASLATLFYALSPRAFLWQVMGGGVTRAFGMLFLLLMAWQAMQLFRQYDHKRLLFVILCGVGAVL